MTFSSRKEAGHIDLATKILHWNGRQLSEDLSEARTWTDEELRTKADFNDEEIKKFRENLNVCGLNSKERNAGNEEEALILASSRVVSYRDALYIYNRKLGIFETGNKAKQRLMYEAVGSGKADKWDFIEFDERSLITRIDTLDTNFIRVGSRFFDIQNGCMVDNAPDEFRTFGIKQDINYEPIRFDDCKSKLIVDLKTHMGADNLKYLLLNVAYNLTTIRVDKRGIIVVGETRSSKGTFNKSMKMIGLAPDVNLRGDFESDTRFCDQLGTKVGLFPLVCADDCKSLNWELLKANCSDETMSVEPKGEQKFTAVNRAMPIITLNSAIRSVIDGIVNKVVIIKTQLSFKNEVDPDYFKKIEAENGFEELICLILTMAHKLSLSALPNGQQWNPSIMPDSVKEVNREMLRDFLFHDLFISEWDRKPEFWTSAKEAYAAYLHYANPDVDYGLIKLKVDELKNATKSQPEGLAGRSWQNFSSSLKLAGIVEKKKNQIVNGKRVTVRGFEGKPPFEDDLTDETLVDFA